MRHNLAFKSSKLSSKTQLRHLPHGVHVRSRVRMCIIAHCQLNISVAHDILQGFRVLDLVGHVGAEGMSQRMGRQIFRQYRAMELRVFYVNTPDDVLIVGGGPGVAGLVAEQEITVTVNLDRLPHLGTFQHTLKCRSNFRPRDGNLPDTRFGFRVSHVLTDGAVFCSWWSILMKFSGLVKP